MHRLTRTVRFNLPSADRRMLGGSNGEGGKPAMAGFGRHYAYEVRCMGEPDANTGYLINITEIDRAVRARIIPLIENAVDTGDDPASMLPTLLAETRDRLSVAVESVGLWLSPYLLYETVQNDPDNHTDDYGATPMSQASTQVIIRQMLEFSAAHRLHVPDLSDDENRAIFGKCNNPGGHGHNYRVEPAVAVNPDSPMSVDAIEQITDKIIIERFDHKHLNDQTDEFATAGGLNPSVENIAKVCFGLLKGPINQAGGLLKGVTVWETDRTCATYPA